ncbi:MAG: folate-binding protein YgfZ [Rhodocyclales bacterium]|nr:folate-binding protein YgfZ [Rhodocyclales bacterium]
MSQDWNDFLSRQGASPDGEHFGAAADELTAARSGTVVAPLPDFGLIRAGGEEAASFLHNLLTNDVKNLAPDAVRFAGLCTAKGRLIASFHIWHDRNDDLLLMLSADIVPGILKKLSMFVLRSKVKLADATAERVLIGLAGSAAEALILDLGAQIPFPLQAVPFADGQIVRLDERRFVLAVEPAAAATVWQRLCAKARPVGSAAWRWLEIAAGQPRIVAGTQEAFVPQMANFEVPAVGGVSFTKGCYPGQEIVARAQYLGKVKRRMYRARLEAPVAPGTHVYAPETGDQHCGGVVSVAPAPEGRHECLVVVQSSCAEAGDVRLGAPGGPRLDLLSLPYTV